MAATAVVLSHAARHIDKAEPAPLLISLFQPGHAGVDLFFTISGFIILFVHRHDIGQPARLRHYLGRRFNRVLPLYWVALSLTIALSLAGRHPPPTPQAALWSATLLPSLTEPLLGIAWTLQYELVFYAVFAVLIVSRAAGLTLMAAWLAWIAAAAAGFGATSVPPALCGLYGLEFFMGMAAAQLLHRGRVPAPRWIAAAAIALFAAALGAESAGLLDGTGPAARFAYGIPAALLVLGLAAAEQAAPLALPQWLRRLGAASYSIYLFQFIFIGAVWQALLAAGLACRLPRSLLFTLLSAAAIGGGLIIARRVEQPLLQFLRTRHRAPG